jgi:hypothetical protein
MFVCNSKDIESKNRIQENSSGQNDHIVGMSTGYYCELNRDLIFWNRVGGMFTYCELNCEFIIWEIHGTSPMLIVAGLNFPLQEEPVCDVHLVPHFEEASLGIIVI